MGDAQPSRRSAVGAPPGTRPHAQSDHADPGGQRNLRVTSIEPTIARLNAASSSAGI
jgi:hypothetical protein